jgi:Methyltransferase domain
MPSGRLFEIFTKTRQFCFKLNSYFPIYEEVFSKFIGMPITFVEVGVFGGGSLFMWREYFGPQARIIGIDVDPAALHWRQHGFEIFIGDQGKPEFWEQFFASVGRIDVLLDDGGHGNIEQVTTLHAALDYINDGGVLLIEDVHTSYMPRFGNPSRYSFINFAKRAIDIINSRFDEIAPIASPLRDQVYSVAFYNCMVAFHVDRRLAVPSRVVANDGVEPEVSMHGQRRLGVLRRAYRALKGIPLAGAIADLALVPVRRARMLAMSMKTRRTLAKFFD